MKAVKITETSGPEGLQLSDVPEPLAGPADVVVRVRAAALNRADLLQSLGLYPAPPDAPADIPGLEFAGEVEHTGPKARRWKVGDRVMGLVGGGAFAERVAVHERELVPMPSRLSFTDAAAIPEAFCTAFDAMVLQAGLRSGETVLIHAVASGVGTAALQLANALGATAVGTGRNPQKLERCAKEFGLRHALLVSGDPPAFAKAVRAVGKGADVVVDLVGGNYLAETQRALAFQARWILIGLLGGNQAELDLGALLSRRTRLFGTVLRSRALEEKIAVAQAFERQLSPLFERGQLKPVVDAVLPMAEIRSACERLASNATFGKLVVEWPER